ncbi:MAG: LysR substrate-binding domain-containing protein [Beijerinckiaceae bacterium]|nr:LysR substrate-binding domain-containing protein [Beijerinckiaceae bacterium]
MRIDFLGLEAFLSIAERGSFHGAAAHLNLSQTALSHRMRKLEDDLGIKLFTRTTRQVTLTPAGLELLPRARQMIDALAASYDALRRQGRERQARLTIGCLPTIATYYLPPILQEFSATYPDITVHIQDAAAGQIADFVQKGEAEFGITIISANRWDLDMRPLLREPYVLLCQATHPLAARAQVSWAELEGVPLVRISPQAANRAIIDDALGSRREFMTWRYEVQHVATAVSLVTAGVALTVVPRLAIDLAGAPGLKAVPIVNPSVSRIVGVVSNRANPLSPAGEYLLKLVAQRFRRDGEATAPPLVHEIH